MLEADEVDKDYFTPGASTSLANLFDNSSKPEVKSGNNSLMYHPPKPEVQKPITNDDKLGLIPIFNCSLIGHHWLNKVYSRKGNIGCSILKVTKDPITDGSLVMVLYNSNKQTLSSISLTSKLQVTVKDLEYVSFYESHESFWCLYGSCNDLKQILEYYKSKNVVLTSAKEQEKGPLEPYKCKNNKSNVESDIDTGESDSTKSKPSILSRMANMGTAVLPKLASNNISTSSSSSEDNNDIRKTNESVKVVAKRNMGKIKNKTNLLKQDTPANMKRSKDERILENDESMSEQNSKQAIDAVSFNSINLFLTEQRISNSELRININRVGHKVENVLNKITNMENQSKYDGTNINTDILHKLLKEYESKIKMYEEILNDKPNINKCIVEKSPHFIEPSEEKDLMQAKIIQLESLTKHKDNEISLLRKKIENFSTHTDDLQFLSEEKIDELLVTNVELEHQIQSKNELIAKLTKQNKKTNLSETDALSGQIKSIMNDTFHGIVANFNEAETYSGEEIRHVVEKVIKNVTISSLK